MGKNISTEQLNNNNRLQNLQESISLNKTKLEFALTLLKNDSLPNPNDDERFEQIKRNLNEKNKTVLSLTGLL